MKKLFSILLIMSMAFMASAQISMNFTPASNDSLVGAVTKYCTLAKPITFQYSAAIEVYLTTSVGANDSTQVTVQGSMDNSTWYDINVGTPVVTGSGAVRTNKVYATIGAANGGVLFQPTWFLAPPYVRLKLQHFVANTSAKITRARIYLKAN